MTMRLAPANLPALLLIALLGLSLAACHKRAAPEEADAQSSRGLKVEAYDVPIAKAPLKGGKLGVMDAHAEAAPSVAPPPAAAASSAPPVAASSQPPADKPQAEAAPPHRLAAVKVSAPAAPKTAEPHFDLYDSPSYPKAAPATAQAAEPGFRITLPVCQRAERMSDPLAKTAECSAMLGQGKEQQRLCAKAFADGDDRIVLSPACRQAASFR